MEYIIDLDALKECLGLLSKAAVVNGYNCVFLKDVCNMIDKFPKDKYGKEYKEKLNEYKNTSIEMSKAN